MKNFKCFEICGEKYKKDHFSEICECSAKELLNMKSFSISKCIAVDKNVYTEKLQTELSDSFFDLKEFIELSVK